MRAELINVGLFPGFGLGLHGTGFVGAQISNVSVDSSVQEQEGTQQSYTAYLRVYRQSATPPISYQLRIRLGMPG